MFYNEDLYEVVHADGRVWTNDDMQRFALDHPEYGFVWCDMDGFYVSEGGGLWLADECGNRFFVDEDEDRRIRWVKQEGVDTCYIVRFWLKGVGHSFYVRDVFKTRQGAEAYLRGRGFRPSKGLETWVSEGWPDSARIDERPLV